MTFLPDRDATADHGSGDDGTQAALEPALAARVDQFLLYCFLGLRYRRGGGMGVKSIRLAASSLKL